MATLIPTEADREVAKCIKAERDFALIAGAGSGKTTSLIEALTYIGRESGPKLRQTGQRVACITYTNRAVDVIRSRLKFDELYEVTTLHSFLWREIRRFQHDIRLALKQDRIPALLAKAREDDSGKNTQKARRARTQVERYESALSGIDDVPKFNYDNSSYSDYIGGTLSHDDVIEIAGYLISERKNLRKLLGMKYPYIFVDEAQDTFESIVSGLNLICSNQGLPLVGYFGDPWQQIYDGRAAGFGPPEGGLTITKKENFRCSRAVIKLLNAFRDDVEQVPAGENAEVEGSVEIRLVQAEEPEGDRKRYTNPQIDRALEQMDRALDAWGWRNRDDVTRLFLVRQMIARRLGFAELQTLFTGPFASARAEEDYESGEHYLLKPFIKTIWPLVEAQASGDQRAVIDILRANSPAFDMNGPNAKKTLRYMMELSKKHLKRLGEIWAKGFIKEALIYVRDHGLVSMSDHFLEQLAREPRSEVFDEDEHSSEKGDWLADSFFSMQASDLKPFCKFMLKNTNYSTQHGVKGEEYPNVLVVYDDIEAAWNNYSFTKLLIPQTAGEPTDGQRERGRKLAYVSFSRAEENLRILLFTPDPDTARRELIKRKLFNEDQITIV